MESLGFFLSTLANANGNRFFSSWLTHESISLSSLFGSFIVLTRLYLGSIMPPALIQKIFSRQKVVVNLNKTE